MKVFIAVLVLIFGLQSWARAEDISDFEIEGMSIGDSLLDYFTKNELNNAYEILNYKNNVFRYYFLSYSKAKDYEYLQITVKPKDKNFLIYGVQGHIFYKNNIENCYKKWMWLKQKLMKF